MRGQGPERTCVGCRARVRGPGRDDMVRLALAPSAPGDGRGIVVDLAGGAPGRGAHVHVAAACLKKAAGKELSRALRAEVPLGAAALSHAIAAAAANRAEALLAGAARAGQLIVQPAPLGAALGRPGARMVVVRHATVAGEIRRANRVAERAAEIAAA